MKSTVRPDVIRLLIDAYEEVRPRLLENQPGFPAAAALRDVVDARVGTPVVPNVAGTAHVILAVEDDGVPSLTSCRRIIFDIQPAAPSAPKP